MLPHDFQARACTVVVVVHMRKTTLRSHVLSLRSAQSPREREEKSNAIAMRVLASVEWINARTIMLYASTPREVHTTQLIESALREGKRVCLPAQESASAPINAYAIRSMDELERGSLGFVQPPALHSRLVSKKNIDVVIVPGVAFDEKGNRLGRGMHFYDDFLAGMHAVKIGLAFELQIVENVPTEAHDVPVDLVVTEKRLFRCR